MTKQPISNSAAAERPASHVALTGDRPVGRRSRIFACGALSLLLFANLAQAAPPVANNVGISGVREVGSTLTGDYQFSDPDGDNEGTSTYSWYRWTFFCLSRGPIVSTARQYVPVSEDQGNCLSFVVTPVSQSGPPDERTGAAVESQRTGTIAAQNFPPVASNVSIAGTTEVGFTLTGSYTYSDANGDTQGTSTFRWLRNGAPIAGATQTTYALVAADQGTTIIYEVTPVATSGASPGTAVQSQGVGPIRPANTAPVASAVAIAGTPEVGVTLTGSYTYNDADGDQQGNTVLRWYRNNAVIAGASSNQYVLVQADLGATIRFEVTPVAATGVTQGVAVSSANFGPVRAANTAPVASNVTISGSAAVGSALTGQYNISDADGDQLGTPIFRWLRDDAPITGATTASYTIVAADVGRAIRFEVTPVALTGVTPGLAVRSAPVTVNNRPPQVTAQVPLSTDEDTPLTLVIDNFTFTDPDDPNLQETYTLQVQPPASNANYTRNGNTITPNENYNGSLTVPIIIRDRFNAPSTPFNATVTVEPVNDAPRITGQQPDPLAATEDTALAIDFANALLVDDPDNPFPANFTMALQEGNDYTFTGNVLTPAENFNGRLSVGVVVSDPEQAASNTFRLRVDVAPVNDQPTLVAPIVAEPAVENSPFELDISGNFTDVDEDPLTYAASWSPQQPPNISFDADTGIFSGTPAFEDSDVPNSMYTVAVTAEDPSGELAGDSFALIISALDRANLALDVTVSPETGQPGDELRWTFTVSNPFGPEPGANVELTGNFIAPGLIVTPDAGTQCTMQPAVNDITAFSCVVGAVPVGETVDVVLTTVTSAVSEVLVTAVAESSDSLPIDPNLEDNVAVKAAGVGLTFSAGAVQNIGAVDARAIAAGDLNGDGAIDIVIGTAAGQPVQVYFGDQPRESCSCQRDFVATPAVISNTGNNEGVALGDFDNNGTLDLVIATGDGQDDVVYSNDGDGNFTLMATLDASFAAAVAVADFNADGNLDIAIAADGPNPVYLGNGAGAFVLDISLGDADTRDVAAALINNDEFIDLVFANTGSLSKIWLGSSAGGFVPGQSLSVGDTSSVAAADLDADGLADLVFGRVTATAGQVPSNPVLINNGKGSFGGPVAELGLSPTYDVQVGDVNDDGMPDLVFINASGVHQTWMSTGAGFTLHNEQIIDSGAVAGVLGNFGETAEGVQGGTDLAIGGATTAGVGVYLNDGSGNLGRGDVQAPTLELLGDSTMDVAAGSIFTDPGTSAIDNIDGDISDTVTASNTVSTAIVGTQTLTYNVADFAGNSAAPISRTVRVIPASGAGGGGGGGGAISLAVLAVLSMLTLIVMFNGDTVARRISVRRHAVDRKKGT